MKVKILLASVLILTALIIVVPQVFQGIDEVLNGYEEVPSVSTRASGVLRARIINERSDEVINFDQSRIQYELSYSNLEGAVTQAHIHLGQASVNGGISVWLCSNLASPPTPAGTQPCPPPPATISGTITAANVVGPTVQGIAPGEFAELIRALRAGKTYVNVHSDKFPGGEVRSQIDGDAEHAH
jgi:hypothetical protein